MTIRRHLGADFYDSPSDGGLVRLIIYDGGRREPRCVETNFGIRAILPKMVRDPFDGDAGAALKERLPLPCTGDRYRRGIGKEAFAF
jgi:hypothetical protein